MSNLPNLEVMTIDFETRSFLSVKDVGAWRYAEDETTEVLCMSYKLGDGRTLVWVPPMPFPQVVLDHIEARGAFESHHAQFERAIWKCILCKGKHMTVGGVNRATPVPMPTRWMDSQAVCAYRAIPLALDKAGAALALPIQKDQHGKYLLQTLSMPKGPTKAEPNRVYREDFDLMEDLYDYCGQDSDAEHKLSWALGPLPLPEQRIWVMDQQINQRGVRLDMAAVHNAITIAERIEEQSKNDITKLTDGEVTAGTQRDRLIKWLQGSGLRISNLQKETVEDTIAGLEAEGSAYRYVTNKDVDVSKLIQALRLRQVASKASTKKLYKMRETVCADGRVRGMLQYHGAATGRWAGRLVQPHNFPRGDKLVMGIVSMEDLIAIIKLPIDEAHEMLTFLFPGKVIDALSSSLRGMLCAEEGYDFMVADFAAIEARVVMWMAQELNALAAFEAYDRGEGPDIYCVMAEQLYARSINKKDNPDERQLGKVTILGCGYQMGVNTFIYQAKKDYGLDLDEAMGKKAVYGYREAYPGVVALWKGLNLAAIQAVLTGKPHSFSCVTYRLEHDNAGTWLSCQLPNGRKLWYFDPIVEESMVVKPWDKKSGKLSKQLDLTYMGRNNKLGGTWCRISTYGGMLTENCVQAIARDLMVEGMIRVESKGYPIILTVHDEIVSEVKKGFGSLDEFNSLMAGPRPSWAHDCPVAVEGWIGPMYKK